MEESKTAKRIITDELVLEPVLIKIHQHRNSAQKIRIDKNEFKIGRARDNDEIILDAMISRRHCLLRCEGNGEWIIKNLSSTCTIVNGVALDPNASQRLSKEDIVQFSTSNDFVYKFTFMKKEEHEMKRARTDEFLLDNIFIQQNSPDPVNLMQPEKPLSQENSMHEKDKGASKCITVLEDTTKNHDTCTWRHLHTMYSELLQTLMNERLQFETCLNEEKLKWQEALNVSKQEKDQIELQMKVQMDRWKVVEEWRSMMENRVTEEKNIQAQLLNEKNILETKLRETENALNEQKKSTTTCIINNSDHEHLARIQNFKQSCTVGDHTNVKDRSNYTILDTIDLTDSFHCDTVKESDSEERGFKKVGNIMEEQLTCSICSELFVKPTILSCMHTFCEQCILCWTKKRRECPICRVSVTSMNRCLVLDNFIDSMTEYLPGKFKDRRKQLVQERGALKIQRNTHRRSRQKWH